MKIFLASDLHFEFHLKKPDPFPIPPPELFDTLVLAGDIADAGKIVQSLEQIRSYVGDDKHIVYVAGNHEYYSNRHNKYDYNIVNNKIDEASRRLSIHFLNDSTVTIDGVTFIGSTLWSDFDCLGESLFKRGVNAARESIFDYKMIRFPKDEGSANKRMMTPEDSIRLSLDSRRFIESSLKQSNPSTTVVVTHFPPSLLVRDTTYPLGDPLLTYFHNRLDSMIEKYQPNMWLYGHTHNSSDINIGKTRVVSNQYGYGDYDINCGYQLNKIVEVEVPKNSIKSDFYVAVDVEATCCTDESIAVKDMELIEVGVVVMDQSLTVVDKFESFVRPVLNPELTDFCKGLTGIEQIDVDGAPLVADVFSALEEFLSGYQSYIWGSWGAWDQDQIKRDAKVEACSVPFTGVHVNFKEVFRSMKEHKRPVGLKKAVELSGLNWLGEHHRGLDDAKNLAQVLKAHPRMLDFFSEQKFKE